MPYYAENSNPKRKIVLAMLLAYSSFVFGALTHCILVDASTVICWTSSFVILGVSGLFCSLCSIVSPAKQKRDIGIAFPASSSSAAALAA